MRQRNTEILLKRRINELVDNQKQIEKAFIKESQRKKKEWELLAISTVTATMSLVLHDKFGFGKKRMNRLVSGIKNQFELVRDDFITVDDFENWAKDKGIEL